MFRRAGNKSTRRALRFEQFESRRLMAVTTSFTAGSLLIAADSESEDITVFGTINPGEIVVGGNAGTRVNGVVNGGALITGVVGHLIIDLGSGTNTVSVDNLYTADFISISGGNGNDAVLMARTGVVSCRSFLSINLGGGDDVVREGEGKHMFIDGQSYVNVGDGTNQVFLLLTSSTSHTSVAAFDGNDTLSAFVVHVSNGSLILNAGGGDNRLHVEMTSVGQSVDLIGYNGHNTFEVNTVSAVTGLRISGNLGPSTPQLRPTSSLINVISCAFGSVQIVGTFAHDDIRFASSHVAGVDSNLAMHGSVLIDAAEGNDELRFFGNVVLEDLFAFLGGGDDYVDVQQNEVGSHAELDGQLGTNGLKLVGNLFGGSVTRNFTMLS